MKRIFAIIGIIIMLIAFLYYSSSIRFEEKTEDKGKISEDTFDGLENLELTKIDDNIWVHTSYIDYDGVRTPSNGLIIITSEGLLLIDTPWNDKETKDLITAVENKFDQPIVKAIITHAHSDRIGGINELIKAEIKTYSTSLTAELAVKNGYQKPKIIINSNDVINLGSLSFEIFYPGEGHSKDNIVVWLPEEKILFAGCIVKSLEAETLGNATDSNIKEWGLSLEKIIRQYKDASIIIPGHGKWGDFKLIEHTLRLIKESK